MKNKTIYLMSIVLCFILSNTLIYAQHHDEHTKQESHDHHSKHHVAVFNGGTTIFSHEITAYTIGVDYEYRISKLVGMGFLGEIIMTESNEIVTGISVFAHPIKGLKFVAAPLIVYSKPHQTDEHHVDAHDIKRESHLFFRIGAGYDFHFGKFSVGPSINYDIGKVKAINYGLSVGVGF